MWEINQEITRKHMIRLNFFQTELVYDHIIFNLILIQNLIFVLEINLNGSHLYGRW